MLGTVGAYSLKQMTAATKKEQEALRFIMALKVKDTASATTTAGISCSWRKEYQPFAHESEPDTCLLVKAGR